MHCDVAGVEPPSAAASLPSNYRRKAYSSRRRRFNLPHSYDPNLMTASANPVTASLRQPALRSPEFGLALGLVVGRFALDMQDLHYGYWTDDLEVRRRTWRGPRPATPTS